MNLNSSNPSPEYFAHSLLPPPPSQYFHLAGQVIPRWLRFKPKSRCFCGRCSRKGGPRGPPRRGCGGWSPQPPRALWEFNLAAGAKWTKFGAITSRKQPQQPCLFWLLPSQDIKTFPLVYFFFISSSSSWFTINKFKSIFFVPKPAKVSCYPATERIILVKDGERFTGRANVYFASSKDARDAAAKGVTVPGAVVRFKCGGVGIVGCLWHIHTFKFLPNKTKHFTTNFKWEIF